MSNRFTSTRIKEFRQSQGLSQQQFADSIGVSRSYLGDIEAGRSQPSRHFIASITSIYKVSSDWLLGHAPDQHQANVADPKLELIQKWLLDFWAGADEDERGWLMVQLKRHLPPFQEWLERRKREDQQ